LVLVHEFGHFIVAKKSGMQVDEFGFGFPPRLFGIKKGGTLYSVNLLPLGGFVKIAGENNEDYENPKSFVNKSFFARFFTLAAGVIMNFLLACVLLTIGFGIGLPTEVPQGLTLPARATIKESSLTIVEVVKDSPAAKAGLLEGDMIAAIDGKPFANVDDLITYVKSRAGNNLDFEIKRGSEDFHKQVFSRTDPPSGQGAIGIAPAMVGRISFPWYYAPVVGFNASVRLVENTFSGFYHLFVKGEGFGSVGGPVKIASMTGQVAKLGFPYLIQFAALLSINLAVLNIIPFPALDGGRILFLVIEKIRGKKNNQKIEQWFNTAGFALLLLLIIFITVRDVTGLIH
jgi:regulator of sigma E protease